MRHPESSPGFCPPAYDKTPYAVILTVHRKDLKLPRQAGVGVTRVVGAGGRRFLASTLGMTAL